MVYDTLGVVLGLYGMLQTRVTYVFPQSMMVRYADRVPRRGERIRNSGGELFVVGFVERELDGAYLVDAMTPSMWVADSKRQAMTTRKWSESVRQRARAMQTNARAVRDRLQERIERPQDPMA